MPQQAAARQIEVLKNFSYLNACKRKRTARTLANAHVLAGVAIITLSLAPLSAMMTARFVSANQIRSFDKSPPTLPIRSGRPGHPCGEWERGHGSPQSERLTFTAEKQPETGIRTQRRLAMVMVSTATGCARQELCSAQTDAMRATAAAYCLLPPGARYASQLPAGRKPRT